MIKMKEIEIKSKWSVQELSLSQCFECLIVGMSVMEGTLGFSLIHLFSCHAGIAHYLFYISL